MRGGLRVSAVSIFCWFYRLKVVIKVRDITFDSLTILFLINYSELVYITKVVRFYKYFNIVKENSIVYKLYCW